jgi:hypothetical protein
MTWSRNMVSVEKSLLRTPAASGRWLDGRGGWGGGRLHTGHSRAGPDLPRHLPQSTGQGTARAPWRAAAIAQIWGAARAPVSPLQWSLAPILWVRKRLTCACTGFTDTGSGLVISVMYSTSNAQSGNRAAKPASTANMLQRTRTGQPC